MDRQTEEIIRISLACSIKYDKEAQCYCAHCSKLNIYSAGRTEKEAAQAMAGAVQIWARHYEKHGILRDMLVKHGAIERHVNIGFNGDASHVTSPATLAAV